MLTEDWPKIKGPKSPKKTERDRATTLVTGFLKARPDLFNYNWDKKDIPTSPYPCPRAWSMLIELFAAEPDLNSRSLLADGTVGEATGREFIAWAEQFDLPDPANLLAEPEKSPLPSRTDQVWATLHAVERYAFGCVSDTEKPNRGQRVWNAAWTYMSRIADKFGVDYVIPVVVTRFAHAAPNWEIPKLAPKVQKALVKALETVKKSD
jgi:hypothetical protein